MAEEHTQDGKAWFLNRMVLALAIVGGVVTLHLWIQETQNFDRGCWGVGTVGSNTSACSDPVLQRYSHLLGIPNAIWGYIFFAVVAILAFIRALVSSIWVVRLWVWSEMATIVAVPYSVYLVYVQAGIAHAYCPLCLCTTGLALTIALIHGLYHWRKPLDASRGSGHEIGYVSMIGFSGMVLAMGVLVFVDQIGSGSVRRTMTAQRERLPKPPPPIKVDEWIEPAMPFLGKADGVSVVAFLDPNCPHCRETYQMLSRLAIRSDLQAKIYIVPRVLWKISIPQTEALEVAQKTGKYYDCWQAQLERQKPGGLGHEEMAQLFQQCGFDPNTMDAQLNGYQSVVEKRTVRERAAEINVTPTIFVNGMPATGKDRTESGLAALIATKMASRTPAVATAVIPVR